MFSTDEEDIDDIGKYGHLDHRVRTSIAMGILPIEAIRMGSLNAAAYLGKTNDLGGIAPGRTAFINLVEDLSDFQISQVIYGSSVVAEGGRYTGQTSKPVYPSSFYNTIRLKSRLDARDFQIQCNKDSGPVNVRVIQVTPRQARTQEKVVSLSAINRRVDPNPELDVAKISVIERHVGSGKIANAFLKGLGLRKGAFGISYQPGPLHIGIVGMNDADMALAANRIAELGGGFVAASDGRILTEVALPVLGFLSAESAEDVLAGFRRVKAAIRQNLGTSIEGLYTTLAYIFMPGAIPEIRMSIDGLVRITHTQHNLSIIPVSLFVE
jgi:adenine deaminase